MKPKLFLLMEMLGLFLTAKSFAIFNVTITPVNPTVNDSVQISYVIAITDYGLKFNNGYAIHGDTVFISGCYFCGCFTQIDAEIYDTIRIAPLSSGIHHVHIITNFGSTVSDSVCNPGTGYLTKDTFFIVSPANSVEPPSPYPFYAALLSFNKLKIVTDETGELAISVYDAPGRKIYNRQMPLQQKESGIDLDLPELPRGIYFYAVVVNEKRKVLRFVKQ